MARISLLSLLTSALLMLAAAWAASAQDSDLRLRAEATLVVIPVSVTDASNRFILGLQKKDFHLLEGGVEQTITQFAGEDAPLSVGLLIDTSGSMGSKLDVSQRAARQFLKTTNAQDEAFLVEFSDKPRVISGFTGNPAALEDDLKALEPGGLTALLDALNVGLTEMKKARNPRKALLVISDGGDNNSRYTAAEIQKLVREADVQVYAIGVFEQDLFVGLTHAEMSGPALLKQIAEQTGGRAFSAGTLSDLPAIAARIGIELRNQYVLAYAPTNRARDGSYRKVEVKVKQPQGLPALKTRWRLGYYAESQ